MQHTAAMGIVAGTRAGSARRHGWVLGFIAAILLWGANWPVMKAGLTHVTPLWFSALRFAAGAVCLFAIHAMCGSIHRPRRADLPLIASIGLLQMAGFTAFGMLAMTVLPAGRSAILSYTTPIWVTPLAILLFRERVTKGRLMGIVLGTLGIVVLVNPLAITWSDPAILSANALLLLAAACWAFCILHLRHGRPATGVMALAPWQMLLAAALLAAAALHWEGSFTGDGTARFWFAMLFVGPVATAFCFVMVNAASTRLPATTMSVAMLGVPLTGLFLSVLLLGERIDVSLALGTVCIAAGIIVTLLGRVPEIHVMQGNTACAPKS